MTTTGILSVKYNAGTPPSNIKRNITSALAIPVIFIPPLLFSAKAFIDCITKCSNADYSAYDSINNHITSPI